MNNAEWHLIDRIEASPVVGEPFPHLVTANIFDADTFAGILEHFPSMDVMTDYTATRKWIYAHGHDPKKNHKRIEDINNTPLRRFWTELGGWLSSDAIKQALFDKFELDPKLSSFTTIRCMTDLQGYHITKHPDAANKVISMLLYCPEDASHPEWGTSVEGYTAPFVPNQMFAFPKRDDSWHWVNPITTKKAIRNQVLVVYEK